MIPRRRGTATAVAVLLVAALVGWWITRRADEQALASRAQAIVAPTASAVAARLDADALSLVAVTEIINGDLGSVAGAVRQLGAMTSAGSPLPVQVATSATDLRVTPAWRAALDTARDDGTPRVAAGSGPAGRVPVLIVAPVYRGGGVPPSVGERRARLVGYLTAVVRADVLLDGVLPAPGAAIRAQVTDGPTVVDASVAGGRAAATGGAPVSIRGANWTVEAWPGPSHGLLPWAALAFGIALALGVGLIARRASRRSEVLTREAVARADELRLVARTGPPLQQSLELGELLPVFVVEVSEELDLDRVGISLMSERGQLVKVFSVGPAGVETTAASLARVPPRTVAEGEEVVIPLQRSGRLVGAFSARARSGLGEARMDTLRAVCDLLAAALGNAALFQQEQDMVHRLRDLDRMKTTFLGSVSHELRTMVTAISGFANLLVPARGAEGDGRQAEYIERIHRNARSLGLLVDDLLDFARLERSGLSVALQRVDLSALVPGVVDQMSSIMIGHPLELEIEPGVTAHADSEAIERILVNLLSNAAKYTPPGTTVAVAVSRRGDTATLTVSDNGPGIPVDERARVFGLFYRSDNPSTQAARGVGIGLALVAELTSLLHGTVTVDDAPGGGARFCVSLPAEECGTEPDRVLEAAPQLAGGTK